MAVATRAHLAESTPAQVREVIRSGAWQGTTTGVAMGYVQANLAIVPHSQAFDFLLFCQRNPRPCPVLDVTEPGSPVPRLMAPGADLRTDLPRYRVYRHGELVDAPTDICDYWREDLVGFLLGCSLSFEAALLKAGVPLRHHEDGQRVPVYTTNIECRPAGIFEGPMVVSMRPIPAAQVARAVQVTTRFTATHGAPIHVGNPAEIGVDLERTEFGSEPVRFRPGDVPVFWACGITPQAVAMRVKPELMITHYPEHMFVTDLRDEEIATL